MPDVPRFTITLTHAEALVLFEWLARTDGQLPFVHDAEQTVLWRLEGQLENSLPVLEADYLERVTKARDEVLREPSGVQMDQGADAISARPLLEFIADRFAERARIGALAGANAEFDTERLVAEAEELAWRDAAICLRRVAASSDAVATARTMDCDATPEERIAEEDSNSRRRVATPERS